MPSTMLMVFCLRFQTVTWTQRELPLRIRLLSPHEQVSDTFLVCPPDPLCLLFHSVDVRFLLGRAVQTPGMHIQSSEPLHTPAALHRASIVFRVLPESAGAEAQKRPNDAQEHPATGSAPHDNTGNGATDLYSPIYAPNTWVPFSIARSTFPYPHVYAPLDGSPVPAYLPGTDSSAVRETAFDSWVHSLLTLTPHAGVPEIRNSKQAWAKFLSTFATAEGLLGYEPTLRAYIKQMCYTCIEDGVPYLETRLNFLPQVSAALLLLPCAYTNLFLTCELPDR